MSIFGTPNSGETAGFNSFGAVGKRSFNCLLDEQVGTDKLGLQMGLIAYNLLSFWTPGYFRPATTGTLDWFTTALLNYYQLKTMLTLGFTDDSEYLSNLSKAYNTYVDALSRRGLAMNALLQLPNSNERSMYGFMLAATFDMLLVANTSGERSLDDLMLSLYSSYGGREGYLENELYGILRDLGLPEIQTLIDNHFKQAKPIDFSKALAPYGLSLDQMSGEGIDIGFRVKGGGDLSVEWVEPGGPAQLAGIVFGDQISEVRGFKASKASDIPKVLTGLKPGDDVDITVLRNGAKKSMSLKLSNLKYYLIKPMPNASESARVLWAKYKTAH
jgi:predicted metalloprotease with PDZ domain